MHPNNARVSVHPTGMGSGHRYYPDELNLGRLVSLDQPTQRSVLIIRLISLSRIATTPTPRRGSTILFSEIPNEATHLKSARSTQ